jgi:hypothetical protein
MIIRSRWDGADTGCSSSWLRRFGTDIAMFIAGI